LSGGPASAAPEPVVAEVAVIGAGPAGASAAAALAKAGIGVAVIDEAREAGGRIWRAAPPALRPPRPGPEAAEGDRLRARLAASGAMAIAEAVVWSVGRSGDGWRIDMLGPDGPCAVSARRLLVAVGTTERVIPFPGWTTPGVVGLAATTVLLKSQKTAPGRRVVVAGSGPLLASVAAGVLKAGAEVAAVADLASAREWLRAGPALVSRPGLAARGAGWTLAALRGGVRPRFRTTVLAAEGEERLEAVRLGPVDADGAPVPGAPSERIGCDALAIGHGLSPATEITRLLRAGHVFDRDLGGWRPETDAEGRTSVPGLYVAGDGAGVRGAAHAQIAGARAAAAIAADLRRGSPIVVPDGASRAARLGTAMSRLTRQRPGLTAAIPPGTVVCRCEDVTRAEIDAAIDDGATGMNQLKHFTRCGMGPCQGRSCADAAAELLALRLVADGGAPELDAARTAAGQWTGRTPLRPVPLDALTGAFDYDDIPVPEPAPL